MALPVLPEGSGLPYASRRPSQAARTPWKLLGRPSQEAVKRAISHVRPTGLLSGVFFGWATIGMTKFVYNQLYIEGPVVLAMSYFCFWVGELVTSTSAVIAVVVMGLCATHTYVHQPQP